jgi:hypothetical protein
MWGAALTGQSVGLLSSVSMAHVFPPTSPVSNSGLGAHGNTEETGCWGVRNRGRENSDSRYRRKKAEGPKKTTQDTQRRMQRTDQK